ncbi:MAG: hypothetical protein IJQ06_06250 [Paludibacteraceae bacterium]|nr:hypothetical protein [Paludibacteraceae bacterium]
MLDETLGEPSDVIDVRADVPAEDVKFTVPDDTEVNVIFSTVLVPVLILTFDTFTEPFLPELDVSTILTLFLLLLAVKTLSVIVPSSDDNVPLERSVNVTLLTYISDFVAVKVIVITSPFVPVEIALLDILDPLLAAVLL